MTDALEFLRGHPHHAAEARCQMCALRDRIAELERDRDEALRTRQIAVDAMTDSLRAENQKLREGLEQTVRALKVSASGRGNPDTEYVVRKARQLLGGTTEPS